MVLTILGIISVGFLFSIGCVVGEAFIRTSADYLYRWRKDAKKKKPKSRITYMDYSKRGN